MVEPKNWLVSREQMGYTHAVAEHMRAVVQTKFQRELDVEVSPLQKYPWFVERHLNVVENEKDWIINNCDEAKGVDHDEASIVVWGHDYGKLEGWDYSHHAAGAIKTKKWLLDNGIPEETSERIYQAILKHRAKGKYQPETPLEKVIASADALSHFDGAETGTVEGFLEREGFWYQVWKEQIEEGISNDEILKSSFKKMERDATSKQGFKESRERAEKEYEFMKENSLEILQRIRED